MKTCTKCGETKPLEQFYKNRPDCIVCVKSRHKKHYKNHKPDYSRSHKEWVRLNPEQRLVSKRRYNAKKISLINDTYCKEVLSERRGFHRDQITPELIKAQRALIKLKRAVKGTVV